MTYFDFMRTVLLPYNNVLTVPFTELLSVLILEKPYAHAHQPLIMQALVLLLLLLLSLLLPVVLLTSAIVPVIVVASVTVPVVLTGVVAAVVFLAGFIVPVVLLARVIGSLFSPAQHCNGSRAANGMLGFILQELVKFVTPLLPHKIYWDHLTHPCSVYLGR